MGGLGLRGVTGTGAEALAETWAEAWGQKQAHEDALGRAGVEHRAALVEGIEASDKVPRPFTRPRGHVHTTMFTRPCSHDQVHTTTRTKHGTRWQELKKHVQAVN